MRDLAPPACACVHSAVRAVDPEEKEQVLDMDLACACTARHPMSPARPLARACDAFGVVRPSGRPPFHQRLAFSGQAPETRSSYLRTHRTRADARARCHPPSPSRSDRRAMGGFSMPNPPRSSRRSSTPTWSSPLTARNRRFRLWSALRAHSKEPKRHAKSIYCRERKGRLNAPGGPGQSPKQISSRSVSEPLM
jgi:hypothetical protein